MTRHQDEPRRCQLCGATGVLQRIGAMTVCARQCCQSEARAQGRAILTDALACTYWQTDAPCSCQTCRQEALRARYHGWDA